MKELRLDGTLKELDGKEVKKPDGDFVTMRSILLNFIGSYKAKDGEEAIQMFRLGSDIAREETSMKISENDVAIIMKAINANTPSYSVVVVGQAAMLLKGE